MSAAAGTFAAVGLALYAGHHVGDYWVQTDRQAKDKGRDDVIGVAACISHVTGYVVTQHAMLVLLWLAAGVFPSGWGWFAGLAVSGITHYMADRRECGLMFKLARKLPGKAAFMELGRPRSGRVHESLLRRDDNPQLATGAWALDQAWHIFWGVFVSALVMVAL